MHVSGYANRVASTVGSFVANLPEMLGAMAVDPRCLVAVVEFGDLRYVQFWVETNGTVFAEVISNLNIGDAVALSEDDEDALRTAGWAEPSPGPTPNWRYESHDAAGLVRTVAMVHLAVYEVLGERAENVVQVRTWCIEPHRVLSDDDVRAKARVYLQRPSRESDAGPDDTASPSAP